jgi:hypothetical protein
MQAQARSLWKRRGKHLPLDLAGNFQIAFDTFVLGDGNQGGPQFGQGLLQRGIFSGQGFDQRLLFLQEDGLLLLLLA